MTRSEGLAMTTKHTQNKKEEIEMGMIQDFQEADKERRSEVAVIRREVADMLNETDNMLKDLAKGSAQRRSEVNTMRSGVATMLKDFATEDAERRSEVAGI